jgi:hypothetical protein
MPSPEFGLDPDAPRVDPGSKSVIIIRRTHRYGARKTIPEACAAAVD